MLLCLVFTLQDFIKEQNIVDGKFQFSDFALNGWNSTTIRNTLIGEEQTLVKLQCGIGQ